MSLCGQVLLVRIYRLGTHGKRENMRSRAAEDCCPFGRVCVCVCVCVCAWMCVRVRVCQRGFFVWLSLSCDDWIVLVAPRAMTVSLAVYTPCFTNGTYLCAIASQAQRAYAADIPAQVYKLLYLCVSVYARICMGGTGRLSCLVLVRT